MTTSMKEAMTSGVLVDFQDQRGNTIGQSVYTDWRGRPVPCVGDSMVCDVRDAASGRLLKRRGWVVGRHFDVQNDDAGRPCVWVRLVLKPATSDASHGLPRRLRIAFSAN